MILEQNHDEVRVVKCGMEGSRNGEQQQEQKQPEAGESGASLPHLTRQPTTYLQEGGPLVPAYLCICNRYLCIHAPARLDFSSTLTSSGREIPSNKLQ